MKSIVKFIFSALALVIAFASCSKSDDFGKILEEQRRKDSLNNIRIQKIIAEQTPLLKEFAEKNFESPLRDSATGIWYDLIEVGDTESYEYKFNSMGYLHYPKIDIHYKTALLNKDEIGKIVDQTKEGESTTFQLNNLIRAWQYAFFPQKVAFNGKDYPVGGLTPNGLKNGSKIRFVSPSPFCYDERGSGEIPANTPLYFEIDVVSVKDR